MAAGGAKFADGDILFARITPCLQNGKISQAVLVTGSLGFGSTEFFVFRGKDNQVDQSFLYYLSLTPAITEPAKNSMVGASGRQRAAISSISELVITLPQYDEQQRIGELLTQYDDLIETNHRRIALLEESARLLYREWFVKLRFPGHELVKVADGVPEGWSRKTLADLATLNYGKALKAGDRKEGDVPVYGSSGIVGYHNVSLINSPCIIIGRKGNVGSVFFSHVPCFGIDTVYYVNAEQTSCYLMLLLQTMNFISSDAAVPGLNRNYAYGLPVIIPDETTATAFEELLSPVFEQINTLENANKKAAEARDALLPKLMSGQLAV
ncbi:type I restriction enzyme S subunit [Methylobacter tundripaludum]|uniref:Type I restriction enzyme S subunit n=1 Tax=Methylobacter tundripaludum TaxID=173365 RepID=A0A2S6HJY4_9GAMM|nr:restriction endonuclease subunit S [Methylobacter tundripaludum]PPK77808.1 type I restriction enzyme S subunit [Methylobacter tundripaludum]